MNTIPLVSKIASLQLMLSVSTVDFGTDVLYCQMSAKVSLPGTLLTRLQTPFVCGMPRAVRLDKNDAYAHTLLILIAWSLRFVVSSVLNHVKDTKTK